MHGQGQVKRAPDAFEDDEDMMGADDVEENADRGRMANNNAAAHSSNNRDAN
jgi:hypothetical protein